MAALNTPVCDFGWKAPDFSLPGIRGTRHSTQSLLAENGLLIMFICNHCPYVQSIINDLVETAKVLQDHQIGVAAVSSNDAIQYPEDSHENIIKFYHQNQFSFPYLYDETQTVAKQYGAVCTPDFFGFNRNLELQYRGRLDGRGINRDQAGKNELLDAMLLIAETGDGPEDQTPSIGCSIKWKQSAA